MTPSQPRRIRRRLPATFAALLVLLTCRFGNSQTIINVPPSPAPASAGADTIVNILPGGQLANNFQGLAGSTLNIQGGNAEFVSAREGATANVFSGSVYGMYAVFGGIINSHGGETRTVSVDSGAELNVFGGNVIDQLESHEASVHLYGGGLPDYIRVRVDSTLTVHAAEFRQDGIPIAGLINDGDTLTIPFSAGSTLSGVFSSGTPFVLGDGQELPATITLVKSANVAAGPSIISVPSDTAPQGIHQGQQLILQDGGVLPTNFIAGTLSSMQVLGGTIGRNFKAVASAIDMTGGTFQTLDALDGSVVHLGGTSQWGQLRLTGNSEATITATTKGGSIRTLPGSSLAISGGSIPGGIIAEGSAVNISGGELGNSPNVTNGVYNLGHADISGGSLHRFSVSSGATMSATGGEFSTLTVADAHAQITGATIGDLATYDGGATEVNGGIVNTSGVIRGDLKIRGGAFGDNNVWLDGSVELHGYDFQVNGIPVAGLEAAGDSQLFNYDPGSMFTCMLSDGTPFNFAPNDNFQSLTISNGVLRLVRSATPTLASTIVVPDSAAPYGASSGQTVILQDGGALGQNFVAGRESRVEIQGGTVGDNFEADRSEVVVSGGAIGNRWDVFGGAEFVVLGGTLGNEFEIHSGGSLILQNGEVGSQGMARGGTVNMSGGRLSYSFKADAGSTVTISGGIVDSEFAALNGSKVFISGGGIGPQMEAATGSELHISGGRIGSSADARSGSSVTISGGNILESFSFAAGSNLNLSGGSLGDGFSANTAANVVIQGQDFEIDGVPVAGLDVAGSSVPVSIAQNQLFTGTLADGTPFSFETSGVRQAQLVRAADLPNTPSEIHVPNSAAPGGVRAGQHLLLHTGGSLAENFTAGRGSAVTILGGNVGINFEAYQATVDVQGGTISNNADALAGSSVNLASGRIGMGLTVHGGAEFNVSGGLAAGVSARAGAKVHHSGGQIANFQAANSSQTVWDGGTIGSLSVSGAAATLAIHGASFELDGVPISGLDNVGDTRQIDLANNSLLTAILADGTPLVLANGFNSPLTNAQVANGTLSLVKSSEPAVPGPPSQVVTDANAPYAIGKGQSLQVLPGGQLPNNFVAGPESHVQLLGGSIGNNAKAWGGKVDVFGGSVGFGFAGLEGLELAIHGGTFTNGMTLLGGSNVDIFGGNVPSPVGVAPGCVIDIYGTSFLLNNQPISGLQSAGDSVLVTARSNQLLSGVLADGSPLSWRLTNYSAVRGFIGISDEAMLRVHLVPEPTLPLLLVSSSLGLLLGGRRKRIIA